MALTLAIGACRSALGEQGLSPPAQVSRTCEAAASRPQPLRSEGGTLVHAEPQAIAAADGRIVIAGRPVLLRDSSWYSEAQVQDRAATGIGIGRNGSVALIPSPERDSALAHPLVVSDGSDGWEFVWHRATVMPDGSRASNIYHATIRESGWTRPELVAVLAGALWGNSDSSPLLRTAQGLAFAVPLAMPSEGGSIAVMLQRDGRWERRMVPAGTGAGAAYATLHVYGRALTIAYVTGDASPGGGGNALYVRSSADGGDTWALPVRITGQGAHDPRMVSIERGGVAVLWRQRASGSAISEAWLSRSLNGGKTWEPAARIGDSQGLNHIATSSLSDGTSLVLLQRGGPFRREHHLMRVARDGVSTLLRDSVDAATRALMARSGRSEFRILWSRADAVGQARLPSTLVRTVTVKCSGDEVR
jgi:hypothetical protein